VKVAEYDNFVGRTDQYKGLPIDERRIIAMYGLAGEIGSLFSAMKKKLLTEAGPELRDQPNDEIVEEIGDVIWYCFSLAQIENPTTPVNILTHDIALLKREIGGENERAKKIHAALDPRKKDTFCEAAESFPSTKDMTFDHYQKLAFLTARTAGRDLLEVCLAVLWQLSAELLRRTLPEIEITLNRNVADRPVNMVLGEIAWHICAIASLLHLSMNSVVARNVEKVTFRANRDSPTPLHDEGREEFEQFPRHFEIAFVSVQRDISRMYFRGKQFGDELNDNAHYDDGYRFHDVLHLAHIAHLGWSPVVRKLMGRKRKSRNDKVDEVEDGARAQIVEELVLKAIHSEGVRLVNESRRCAMDGPVRAFPHRTMITFRFLKTLRTFVEGHEVWRNQYWEWENAIFDGSEIYFNLRTEQQGTVTVDLNHRTITYSPDVCLDLKGGSVGLGIGGAPVSTSSSEVEIMLTPKEKSGAALGAKVARMIAVKRAIFNALRMSEQPWRDLEIKLLDDHRVCVRAKGKVQERMWEMKAISFQLAFKESDSNVECTAIAIADIKDLA